jgi:prepilin-type N-terminal cleavage/methylation domain-containing protein
MRRLADERGFTLVEVLMVVVLSAGLLGATLLTADNMLRTERDNDMRNDTVEQARNALDVQARQLRNLAKRVSSPVIDTIGPYDLIFQTSDPSRTWVRYCLDTTTAPASTSRGRLWTAELSVPDASVSTPVTAGMRGGCPGIGWSSTRVVADYVTNRRAGQDRPLFAYSCSTGTTCTSTASTYDQVVDITAQTIVDTTPGRAPAEVLVNSGVYMRNQNQAPVANFATPVPTGPRTVVLNGSGSSDFEGRTLNYYWFKQNLPTTDNINCAQPTVTGNGTVRTLWGAAGFIGEGVTLSHTFPAGDGASGTAVPFALVVCDPGDRYGTVGISPQPAQTVQIPT